ncbi:aminotransferase class V-fold PLP-dependent enzyme [Evansella halocellulosilytica]|uniref:aminotransferase class V-fold PLP-dependent enzyme n=1 Tax=Evansella halocellulosilytica TaxID=2011013 RepID=UPI000BB67CC3|nr:aminotransferase class V-fold PLP-dependent enzyme [Evansella halocellulosilytica]
MIYFDNAASSFPKPKGVAKAMSEVVQNYGANPGRGGHQLSRTASAMIDETRKKLSYMFHSDRADRVLFLANATTAINQGIFGIDFQKGDHIISTSFEHNSVRRPLEKLKKEKSVDITYISPPTSYQEAKEKLIDELTDKTKLVIVTHASNLTGEVFPIGVWGEVLRNHSALFFVDASQTAGVLPINMKNEGVDLLAFPGHKGLLGPQGIGVLIAQEKVSLTPFIVGGTGSHSEEKDQPAVWPGGYESGTLNTPGIAGLRKGLEYIEDRGTESIYHHEQRLAEHCREHLNEIEGLEVIQRERVEQSLGVIAFRIHGIDVNEMAMILDDHYKIAVRAGLHCNPLAHETHHTLDTGLVRISFGPFNTLEEVDQFVKAVKEIKDGLLS